MVFVTFLAAVLGVATAVSSTALALGVLRALSTEKSHSAKTVDKPVETIHRYACDVCGTEKEIRLP